MTTYRHPVTPAELSQPLLSLCQEIVPDGQAPVYLDVNPLQGAPSRECFPIVKEYIRTHGGTSVIGWTLWEMPTLFIEAEFHAVWRAPDGRLLDISPKPEPTQRILFLPDPTKEHQGHQVNNVRRSVCQNLAVVGFLQACDDEFEFMNRGARAGQYGNISLQRNETVEYKRIMMRKTQFQLQMALHLPKIGAYTPCRCGSGKKTKWCHGIAE